MSARFGGMGGLNKNADTADAWEGGVGGGLWSNADPADTG